MKTLITNSLTVLVFMFSVILMFFAIQPSSVEAQECYFQGELGTCPAGFDLDAGKCYSVPVSSGGVGEPFEINCATATSSSTVTEGPTIGELIQNEPSATTIDTVQNVQSNPIYDLLLTFIDFLSAGVGLVVVTLVAVGGVQYMTSGGNPQKTQAAIGRITNALIGLVLYIFMFAILQWLIPGGLFAPGGVFSVDNGTSSSEIRTD